MAPTLDRTAAHAVQFDRPVPLSVALHAQGPDVGGSRRSVKHSLARAPLSLGSRSVPRYSSRKSSSARTFGVRRDGPENSAHRVIGSASTGAELASEPCEYLGYSPST